MNETQPSENIYTLDIPQREGKEGFKRFLSDLSNLSNLSLKTSIEKSYGILDKLDKSDKNNNSGHDEKLSDIIVSPKLDNKPVTELPVLSAQSIEKSRDQSIEKSRDQSIEKSRDQSIEKSRDQSIEKSRDQSIESGTNTVTELSHQDFVSLIRGKILELAQTFPDGVPGHALMNALENIGADMLRVREAIARLTTQGAIIFSTNKSGSQCYRWVGV